VDLQHNTVHKGKQEPATTTWRSGEWVLVKIDFPKQQLPLVHEKASSLDHIQLSGLRATPGTCVFHAVLYSAGDHVDILPVTAADQQWFV